MNKRWLLIDCNYLCHRAFHALSRSVVYEGKSIGMVYGFLRDVLGYCRDFKTNNVIFAWDCGSPKRKELYPGYKNRAKTAKRKYPITNTMAYKSESFYEQLNSIRDQILPELGYKNILYSEGFEADDVIASVCASHFRWKKAANDMDDTCIIISADRDLLQLLWHDTIRIFHPDSKRMVTEQSFVQLYGNDITPLDWPLVKALAGCGSDTIEGVKGIGEKTAVRFIWGHLPEKSQAYRSLINRDMTKHKLNLRLVQLPFEGTPTFELRHDDMSKEKWLDLCKKMNLPSIADKIRMGQYLAKAKKR